MRIGTSIASLIVAAALAGPVAAGHDGAVSVNGQRLTPAQRAGLEARIGQRIEPGSYLYDARTRCWANLSTGRRGCLPGTGEYRSRYGSGGYQAGGDWSHHSDIAGGSVGGSGDGCVYAFGWSNC